MKIFLTLLTALVVGPIMSRASEPPDMISWTIGKSNKGDDTLTLWSDGRSEIVLARRSMTKEPSKGWTFFNDGKESFYRKANPFTEVETKRKFAAAVAAGIDQLRAYSPKEGVADAATYSIRLQIMGKITAIDIPDFSGTGKGDEDGAGSENHRRFLAIQDILGKIDTNAYDKSR